MIPRLGDGNLKILTQKLKHIMGLENDSPSRGRKRQYFLGIRYSAYSCLENDSPSRGRKP